jgi:polyferredoxin
MGGRQAMARRGAGIGVMMLPAVVGYRWCCYLTPLSIATSVVFFSLMVGLVTYLVFRQR